MLSSSSGLNSVEGHIFLWKESLFLTSTARSVSIFFPSFTRWRALQTLNALQMDFTVYALSLCLEENAGHSISVKWPLKSSYAAVERDKMPQGNAENPLAQPLKVHCGRGNRRQERMQEFTGKPGQISWSVRMFEMGSPLQYKIQWGKYFEWAWVENITFFTEGEKISARTVFHQSIFQRAKPRDLNPPETGKGLTISPSSLESAVHMKPWGNLGRI